MPCLVLFLLVFLGLRKPNLLNNSQLKEDTEGGDAVKEGETIRCIVLRRHMVEPVQARSRQGNNTGKKKQINAKKGCTEKRMNAILTKP